MLWKIKPQSENKDTELRLKREQETFMIMCSMYGCVSSPFLNYIIKTTQ